MEREREGESHSTCRPERSAIPGNLEHGCCSRKTMDVSPDKRGQPPREVESSLHRLAEPVDRVHQRDRQCAITPTGMRQYSVSH